jgi:anti-sigma-K factor RskA
MIDPRLEELAALYVAGLLSEDEAREFAAALESNSELLELTARLSMAAAEYSGTVPARHPSPQLKARIMAQISAEQKTVELPESKAFMALKWLAGFAAGFAALCATLFVYQLQLRDTIKSQNEKIAGLSQLAATLQSATNDLRREIVALQETNRLANLRIAMLNSVAESSPKTLGVSLWDGEKQSGVFVAENLKALPSDQDYELWVIDETKTPVAAGVFRVDENGRVKMEFRPSRLVKTAGMFAVTAEAKGGVASPTMKNMVLAGN